MTWVRHERPHNVPPHSAEHRHEPALHVERRVRVSRSHVHRQEPPRPDRQRRRFDSQRRRFDRHPRLARHLQRRGRLRLRQLVRVLRSGPVHRFGPVLRRFGLVRQHDPLRLHDPLPRSIVPFEPDSVEPGYAVIPFESVEPHGSGRSFRSIESFEPHGSGRSFGSIESFDTVATFRSLQSVYSIDESRGWSSGRRAIDGSRRTLRPLTQLSPSSLHLG
jgi:hypothetical protein